MQITYVLIPCYGWFHLASRNWYRVKVKVICYMPSSIDGVPCLFLDLPEDIF
jgi:hypothetical protein